ncbi:MAG: glycosyltransferase family A protein, partial [Candidatus Pacebacteria bacterium]|nr:glycosyltransferase family A protein [Candidatus Paceibacterota bacterium]
MKVDVILPTYNRRASLERCLAGLQAQTHKDFEVIVVDDGSRDNTENFIRSQKSDLRLHYIRQENKGPAMARNVGIKNATADYVAFIDDDCIPEKDWLEELVKALSLNPESAGVGGFVVRQNNDLISRYIDHSGTISHRTFGETVIILITCNAIFKRSILEKEGGFNDALRHAEDAEMSLRLVRKGYRFALAPLAIVKHDHPRTLRAIYKMYVCYGNGITT